MSTSTHKIELKHNNKTIVVEVPEDSTLADLKAIIAKETNVPPAMQKLMGNPKLKNDDQKLSSQGLKALGTSNKLMLIGSPVKEVVATNTAWSEPKKAERRQKASCALPFNEYLPMLASMLKSEGERGGGGPFPPTSPRRGAGEGSGVSGGKMGNTTTAATAATMSASTTSSSSSAGGRRSPDPNDDDASAVDTCEHERFLIRRAEERAKQAAEHAERRRKKKERLADEAKRRLKLLGEGGTIQKPTAAAGGLGPLGPSTSAAAAGTAAGSTRGANSSVYKTIRIDVPRPYGSPVPEPFIPTSPTQPAPPSIVNNNGNNDNDKNNPPPTANSSHPPANNIPLNSAPSAHPPRGKHQGEEEGPLASSPLTPSSTSTFTSHESPISIDLEGTAANNNSKDTNPYHAMLLMEAVFAKINQYEAGVLQEAVLSKQMKNKHNEMLLPGGGGGGVRSPTTTTENNSNANKVNGGAKVGGGQRQQQQQQLSSASAGVAGGAVGAGDEDEMDHPLLRFTDLKSRAMDTLTTEEDEEDDGEGGGDNIHVAKSSLAGPTTTATDKATLTKAKKKELRRQKVRAKAAEEAFRDRAQLAKVHKFLQKSLDFAAEAANAETHTEIKKIASQLVKNITKLKDGEWMIVPSGWVGRTSSSTMYLLVGKNISPPSDGSAEILPCGSTAHALLSSRSGSTSIPPKSFSHFTTCSGCVEATNPLSHMASISGASNNGEQLRSASSSMNSSASTPPPPANGLASPFACLRLDPLQHHTRAINSGLSSPLTSPTSAMASPTTSGGFTSVPKTTATAPTTAVYSLAIATSDADLAKELRWLETHNNFIVSKIESGELVPFATMADLEAVEAEMGLHLAFPSSSSSAAAPDTHNAKTTNQPKRETQSHQDPAESGRVAGGSQPIQEENTCIKSTTIAAAASTRCCCYFPLRKFQQAADEEAHNVSLSKSIYNGGGSNNVAAGGGECSLHHVHAPHPSPAQLLGQHTQSIVMEKTSSSSSPPASPCFNAMREEVVAAEFTGGHSECTHNKKEDADSRLNSQTLLPDFHAAADYGDSVNRKDVYEAGDDGGEERRHAVHHGEKKQPTATNIEPSKLMQQRRLHRYVVHVPFVRPERILDSLFWSLALPLAMISHNPQAQLPSYCRGEILLDVLLPWLCDAIPQSVYDEDDFRNRNVERHNHRQQMREKRRKGEEENRKRNATSLTAATVPQHEHQTEGEKPAGVAPARTETIVVAGPLAEELQKGKQQQQQQQGVGGGDGKEVDDEAPIHTAKVPATLREEQLAYCPLAAQHLPFLLPRDLVSLLAAVSPFIEERPAQKGSFLTPWCALEEERRRAEHAMRQKALERETQQNEKKGEEAKKDRLAGAIAAVNSPESTSFWAAGAVHPSGEKKRSHPKVIGFDSGAKATKAAANANNNNNNSPAAHQDVPSVTSPFSLSHSSSKMLNSSLSLVTGDTATRGTSPPPPPTGLHQQHAAPTAAAGTATTLLPRPRVGANLPSSSTSVPSSTLPYETHAQRRHRMEYEEKEQREAEERRQEQTRFLLRSPLMDDDEDEDDDDVEYIFFEEGQDAQQINDKSREAQEEKKRDIAAANATIVLNGSSSSPKSNTLHHHLSSPGEKGKTGASGKTTTNLSAYGLGGKTTTGNSNTNNNFFARNFSNNPHHGGATKSLLEALHFLLQEGGPLGIQSPDIIRQIKFVVKYEHFVKAAEDLQLAAKKHMPDMLDQLASPIPPALQMDPYASPMSPIDGPLNAMNVQPTPSASNSAIPPALLSLDGGDSSCSSPPPIVQQSAPNPTNNNNGSPLGPLQPQRLSKLAHGIEQLTDIGINARTHFPTLSDLLNAMGQKDRLKTAAGVLLTPEHFTHSCRVIVVYFTASWSEPCKRVAPMVIKAYNKLKERIPECEKKMEFLLVSCDRTLETHEAYVERFPFPRMTWPDEGILKPFDLKEVPQILVFAPNGQLMTQEGVDALLEDPEGLRFPHAPWNGAKPLSRSELQILEFAATVLQQTAMLRFNEQLLSREQLRSIQSIIDAVQEVAQAMPHRRD